MPGKIDAMLAATEMVTPFLSTVPGVGAALPLAVSIFKAYRKARNDIEAMNPGASGMLSDRELFDLLETDAAALQAHSEDLIAKWSTQA